MPKRGAFRWDGSTSLGVNARRRLPELVRSYYEEGRKTTSGEMSPEALHAFRLRTKRLRYTVELFRSCYGPGLERWLASLKEIQDHLGALSDCATTVEICGTALPGDSPERARLEAYLQARGIRETGAFKRYWGSVFDRAGEDRRWAIYFKRKTR